MSESIDCVLNNPNLKKKSRSPEKFTNTNKKLKTTNKDIKIQDVKCIDIANSSNNLDMCCECSLSLYKENNLKNDECRFNGWRR